MCMCGCVRVCVCIMFVCNLHSPTDNHDSNDAEENDDLDSVMLHHGDRADRWCGLLARIVDPLLDDGLLLLTHIGDLLWIIWVRTT